MLDRICRWFSRSVWQYGTCRDRPARRHRATGEVQFVLWQAGQHGHTTDYWHAFDSSWWGQFVPSKGSQEGETK